MSYLFVFNVNRYRVSVLNVRARLRPTSLWKWHIFVWTFFPSNHFRSLSKNVLASQTKSYVLPYMYTYLLKIDFFLLSLQNSTRNLKIGLTIFLDILKKCIMCIYVFSFISIFIIWQTGWEFNGLISSDLITLHKSCLPMSRQLPHLHCLDQWVIITLLHLDQL